MSSPLVVTAAPYGVRVSKMVHRPDSDITGCADAQARLHDSIAALTDDDVRRPSLLPDWTIAHVLTHLARNADSHVRMLEGAARGEVVWQYAEGQREREIEEGASRSAAALVADVRESAAALEAAWSALADDVWATGASHGRGGPFSLPQQVVRRWREVEFHHADLGLGFTYADFSPGYVAREQSGFVPPPFAGRTDWPG
jgi:maleylpyruvate isomerase